MTLLDRSYNEPDWLLRRIFGNEQLFAQCYPNNPAQLVTFGIEQAYEILKNASSILDYKGEERSYKLKVKRPLPEWNDLEEMPPMEDEEP